MSLKYKHLEARIRQVEAIASCSSCQCEKAGALLLDADRNVVVMDAYRGGPRGGGEFCGGARCVRQGLLPGDVVVNVRRKVRKTEDAWVSVKGRHVSVDVESEGCAEVRLFVSRAQATAFRERLLASNPRLDPGTHLEQGCHHAEMNVICNAAAHGVRTRGTWLISTVAPCLLCAKMLHHAGILCVISMTHPFSSEGVDYLRTHGVSVFFSDALRGQVPSLD